MCFFLVSLFSSHTHTHTYVHREALNLAESPPHSIKRERDHDNASDYADHSERDFGPPPNKKDPQALLHALHLQSQFQNHYYNHNNRRGPMTPVNNEHNVSEDGDQHQQRPTHLSQRMTSPIRNGSDKSPNVAADILSSVSPVTLLSGMQFKLSSRGKI